jgi:hypothetical protein
MTYKYKITRIDQDLSTEIEVSDPLAHLAVGNALHLAKGHLALQEGNHFAIRAIDTFLDVEQFPVATAVHVTICVEEVDGVGKSIYNF